VVPVLSLMAQCGLLLVPAVD